MLDDLVQLMKRKKWLSSHLWEVAVDNILWNWTGFHGKTVGCPYWSESALEAYERENRLPLEPKLIHEHVIPKSILIELLSKEASANRKTLKDFMNSCVVGAVVTKEEHVRLHQQDDTCDWSSLSVAKTDDNFVFARYQKAKIKVWHVNWSKRTLLKDERYLICKGENES